MKGGGTYDDLVSHIPHMLLELHSESPGLEIDQCSRHRTLHRSSCYANGIKLRKGCVLTHHARYRNPDSMSNARILSANVRRAFLPRERLIRRRCFLKGANSININPICWRHGVQHQNEEGTYQAVCAIMPVATALVAIVKAHPRMLRFLAGPHHSGRTSRRVQL